MTSAKTDIRGIPINVGTRVVYMHQGTGADIVATEAEVLAILDDTRQYEVRRLRTWAFLRGRRMSPVSPDTQRPVVKILQHKCLVVPTDG